MHEIYSEKLYCCFTKILAVAQQLC